MIDFYTAGTPNGHKIAIMLEELAVDYKVIEVDLGANEQKRPEFLKLNPNGKIPVIVDHQPAFGGDSYTVFDSGAILIYLAEKYQRFLSADPTQRYQTIQWLMFQMSGIGPMMGQLNVFRHYAPMQIPFAIKRYDSEARRLFEVFSAGLGDKDYIAGEYSIADIANFAWMRQHEWSGIDVQGLDNVLAWIERVGKRAAAIKGCEIPHKMLGGSSEDDKEKTIKKGQNMLVGGEE